jgi:NAD(P)-dependent dehydrogenase (short-subunit alcohol dehydrogenase family)
VNEGKRVCLLTGARGRLGTAFCKAYAAEYSIVAVYRTAPFTSVASQQRELFDPLDPKARVPENEHPVLAIQADLSEPRAYERVVELALVRFGRIDLVVNAAVHWSTGGLLHNDSSSGSWEREFWMNAILPVQMSVHIAKAFWQNRPKDENLAQNRNVLNISSGSSLKLAPKAGQSFYSASKAALNAFSAHLAREMSPLGVRFNALAPQPFPNDAALQRVTQAIRELDQGKANGQIATLDATQMKLTSFGA